MRLKGIRSRLFISYLAIIFTMGFIFIGIIFLGQPGVRLIALALVVTTVASIGLAVILSRRLARSMADPLQSIAQAAEAVSIGDFDQIVVDKGPEEMKQVSQSVNSMVQHVQANQNAMRDFVANASHELKTPLTSIQGFAQALKDDAADDITSRQRAAEIIHSEATRMRRLIDDLLDLARIEAGQIIIGKSPVDITAILNLTLNSLSAQAESSRVTLRPKYDLLPNVVGDGDRLAQVLLNLIDNAIKHTPAGGSVTVQAEAVVRPPFKTRYSPADEIQTARQYVRIYIIDTGPGIEPADLPRIFERLYQVDKSRKRGQGMGLGLAIAYNIVQVHGGDITVESKLGQGTRFTVWLPTKEADVSTLISRRQFRAKRR